MDQQRRIAAERAVNSVSPAVGIFMGFLLVLIPYVFLFGAFLMVWWVGGTVLSITLGQIVLWAVIFAAGYGFGKSS